MNPLYDLEDVAETLEAAQETKQLAKDLRESVSVLRQKLEAAADVMAAIGKIHNTPYAKREWVEGR